MTKSRPSRLFQPSSLNLARLESLVLLDGSDWVAPVLTGNVGVDVAAVADSKGQLAKDLAAFDRDLFLHKLDVITESSPANETGACKIG